MTTDLERKTYSEKVLTVNVMNYLRSRGRQLEEYFLTGVHVTFNEDSMKESPIDSFIDGMPLNAEAVVDYTMLKYFKVVNGKRKEFFILHGTALIPKNSGHSSRDKI